MKPITLFYSWQSDTDPDRGRHFVRIALETAIGRVSEDLGVEIALDHDTLGEPGTPPVTDTILRKIRECDLFLADMTFVGETPGGKRMPNPNVMAEYGYALHAKSGRRILLVMNTAHGAPDDLPFDLRTLRFPMGYSAPDDLGDGERRKRRGQFAEKLTTGLGEAVKALIKDGKASDPLDAERPELEMSSMLQRWGRSDFPGIVSEPRLLVGIFPFARPDSGQLRPALVSQHLASLVPAGFNDRQADGDANSWWIRDLPRRVRDLPNPERRWYARVHTNGTIDAAINIAMRIEDDPDIVAEGRPMEARIVDLFDRISAFLGRMGLQGDAIALVQMIGCEDLSIIDGHQGTRRMRERLFALNVPTLRGIGGPIGNQLEPLLNAIWMAAGRSIGSPSFAGGDWEGYLGGPDYQITTGRQ